MEGVDLYALLLRMILKGKERKVNFSSDKRRAVICRRLNATLGLVNVTGRWKVFGDDLFVTFSVLMVGMLAGKNNCEH